MDFTKKNCRAMMLFWVVMLNVGSMASLLAVVVGCDHHVGTNTSAYMGHKYVDLQLPSGTKWATANLGGEEDELASEFYSWGELEVKRSYSKNNYQWMSGYPEEYGVLQDKHDVAHVRWEGKWRLPTKEEMEELEDTIHNTTWVFSPLNGHVSWLVKSKRNGQTIRLMALGYMKEGKLEQDSIGFYLGASVGTSMENTFVCMAFNNDTINMGDAGRYFGYTVRPVFK